MLGFYEFFALITYFKQLSKVFFAIILSGIWIVSSAAQQEKVVTPLPLPPNLPSSPVVETQVTSSAISHTTTVSSPQSGPRLWNLQDADILSVINEVSQETGKNFVVDPRVSGKITLISSQPIRQKEVYQVFLSVLGLLGYSAIPSGNVIKIVPNMESIEQSTAIATKEAPGKGEEVVVRVIPLQNVSATQLIPVLRPLLPQWSNISVYAPGNVLILLGRASNLERLWTIIQEVDQGSNTGIQMVPLRYASAVQVANVLNNLQAASRAGGDAMGVTIAVDDRSNSILLGGPKGMRLRMRVLISQLDTHTRAPAGNTEVIYLKYLQAKTLAPLLGRIAQNILGKDSGGASSTITLASLSSSSAGPSSGGRFGSSSVSTPKEPTNTTVIQAEPNTNALIITAPPTLMQALRTVVAKLDIRPAQVLVEAIIAEIDESNLLDLGIQWGSQATTKYNSSNPSGLVTGFPNLGAGVLGLMPRTKIQAVLSALENQNGVDILSTPSIIVLDNQKAVIEVGQMVPTTTGQYANTNNVNTVSPFTTTDYKNVTLKLEVTPQINLGESVRLLLDLKNDTLQNPQNPGSTPLINTSKIKNSVLVNSDDILVIGGLISRSNNENLNKVPILGNLPIVGILFRQKVNNQQKKNLMVFLKPIIINTAEDGLAISQIKYNMIRRTQANFKEDLENISNATRITAMPPWPGTEDLPGPFTKHSPLPCMNPPCERETVSPTHPLPPWKNAHPLPVPFQEAAADHSQEVVKKNIPPLPALAKKNIPPLPLYIKKEAESR